MVLRLIYECIERDKKYKKCNSYVQAVIRRTNRSYRWRFDKTIYIFYFRNITKLIHDNENDRAIKVIRETIRILNGTLEERSLLQIKYDHRNVQQRGVER